MATESIYIGPKAAKNRQLTADEIVSQFAALPLESQLAVLGVCKKTIDERRQKMQNDLDLINSNMK